MRNRRRLWTLVAAASGAVANALIPVAALVTLEPRQYGGFSFVYLVYAFGSSLILSVVCEAWQRWNQANDQVSGWREYVQPLSQISLVAGGLAGAVAFVIEDEAVLSSVMALSVFFATYRGGARFFGFASSESRRVALSDVSLVLGFIAGFAGGMAATDDHLRRFAIAWMVSGVMGCLTLRLPRVFGGHGLKRWIGTRKREVGTLLSDSLLMDAGAVGSPVLVATFLTIPQFGVYRGISNVAMPVRLVFSSLRPVIARRPAARLLTLRIVVLVSTLAMTLGTGAFVVLHYAIGSIDRQIGTLSTLVSYAFPCAVFVAVSCITQLFYVACRIHARAAEIIKAQFAQTVLILVLPTVGCVRKGLDGAVWGFVLAATASAGSWAFLAWTTSRRHRGAVARSFRSR